MVKLIWLACLLVMSLEVTSSWKYDRRPRLYDDKIPFGWIRPNRRKVQRQLVMLHDFFRTQVQPPAANMLPMRWHKGAAESAQKWADKCYLLTHDTPKGRWIPNCGACGQNIFVSKYKVPWLFAIRTWFLEYHNFTYGSHQNDLNVIGNYTQMVWAASHKVGCGLAKCPSGGQRNKPFFNYVCNYCPIGNRTEQLGTPYKQGESCNAADFWANCSQLYKEWPDWLCRTNTTEGLQRQHNCLATCNCQGKIHD